MIASPFFNKCMSKNRFELIAKFLHFNDNGQLPGNVDDKLYKIYLFYNVIIGQWWALCNLGEHISIDEGMLKWRGRLRFRVYNIDKPFKYGIKS